jgi:pimeloyl-ACP methyl ester carboxylesterase
MRNCVQICVFTLLLFISFSVFSQPKKKSSEINYGSNPAVGKYISTRSIKFYYEVYGKGQPLLLIHGNGGSISAFKYQIPYFSKYYKVIGVDSRAQGKSADYGDSLTYEMMADDLNAVLDSLHVDSAYVIGWSDGGINGLLLALRHPEKVRKLAETGANLIPDTSVFDPAGNASLDASIADLRSHQMDKKAKNQYKLLHMMQIEPNIPSTSLRNIKCPVLVIGGDHDVILPFHTLEIFNNINQAYLWILPNSGHATPQRYPDEFNKKVQDFFTHPYTRPRWDDWDK